MGRLCYPTQAPSRVPVPRASGARKLSRCKPARLNDVSRSGGEGMAHFLPSWYKFYCVLARSRFKFDWSRELIPGYKAIGVHWRSVGAQIVSKPEISHGAGFKLSEDVRVRVQQPLQICLGCRSKSKKCDKQLTHIVRVSGCHLLSIIYLSDSTSVYKFVK